MHDAPALSPDAAPRPLRWSAIPYPGERWLPRPEEPAAGSWPLFLLGRDAAGRFTGPSGVPISLAIRDPATIDFRTEQLPVVQTVLTHLTDRQREIALYWAAGPPTHKFTPIADRLISTYAVTAGRAARILAALQAAIQDALIVAWQLKFLWDVPRPHQLDPTLRPIIPVPRHPTYPSGHAVVAGAAEPILSYFFAPEAERIRQRCEECARSRLYAGVHFP
ncbi:MAG TPA: vanadium-dependent haloperoxidase, partial [Limnochordia bacterium]